jgi:SAM-dependent methyltransferase
MRRQGAGSPSPAKNNERVKRMSKTVWDNIYREYLAGGEAWASLKDDIHPVFLSLMEKSTFPVKRALDIGCGQGKYLKYLQMKGFQTSGLDSSESAIVMTKDLLESQENIILTDMYKYQYPLNAYDLIISHATLHHGKKKEVVALLDKIYDSLIDKGKVFISIPSDGCIKNWAMMAEHETLEDGTCIPLNGPEKGLPHSFYSKKEIDMLFCRYFNLEVDIDERGRWIISGEK